MQLGFARADGGPVPARVVRQPATSRKDIALTDGSLLQQRIDLACALRWAARLGLHEGVCNHFSLAVADEDGKVRGDRFLINPYGWHWSEITASSLVLCGAEGNVHGATPVAPPTAFFIQSPTQRKARAAVCAPPTHRPYATAGRPRRDGSPPRSEEKPLLFYNLKGP